MAALNASPARHTVLLYSGVDEFLDTIVPFVEDGVAAGDGVIAVAEPANLRSLRDALGATTPSVRLVDANVWYSRPSDTLGRWVAFALDQRALGRGVRVAGEVLWPEDDAFDQEMRRFEGAATLFFDEIESPAICSYNKVRCPRRVIEAALTTHEGVIEGGAASLSPTYVAPSPADANAHLLPGVPRTAARASFEPYDVVAAIAFVEEHARREHLDEHSVQRLTAAVSELVANTFAHTRTLAHVALWREAGAVVCQVEDEGEGITDPSVGFQPPYGDDNRWGLWLARRCADLLQVGRSERGPAVRLRLRTSAGGT
jgi:anti-sigma regulatory factor (Ser/Thr protein kinase)